jgi:cytochrome c1
VKAIAASTPSWTARTTAARCSSARPTVGQEARSLQERAGGPRRERRRPAAGLVAAREVARRRGGLLYSVLTSYERAAGRRDGPGRDVLQRRVRRHLIAMPAPLSPDQVTYADNTPATVDQMAKGRGAVLAGTPSRSWKSASRPESRRAVLDRRDRALLRLQATRVGRGSLIL